MSISHTPTARTRSEEIFNNLERAVREYDEILLRAINNSEHKTISSAGAEDILKEAAAKVHELTREYSEYAKEFEREEGRRRSRFDFGRYNVWYGVLIGVILAVLAMAVANETIN
ncbi:hypothetical protein DL98DRAFT_84934 [Cadophora sp. DSE1049]|nr:hypothetical protein DL98DRAFT_84934 [Cadophora sp. DSE1049]